MEEDKLTYARLRESTLLSIQLIAAELELSGRLKGVNRATGKPSVDQVVRKLADQWWGHRERSKRARKKKSVEGV